MSGIQGVGGVGGAGGAGGGGFDSIVNRLQGNMMLDVWESSMQKLGVQQSPDTKNALSELRNHINGRQQNAADQCGNCGSQQAGGPEGAGAPQQGGQKGGKDAIMQMLQQLLQLIAQLLQSLGGEQGNEQGNSMAQQLPYGGQQSMLQ